MPSFSDALVNLAHEHVHSRVVLLNYLQTGSGLPRTNRAAREFQHVRDVRVPRTDIEAPHTLPPAT
jgi:hypothetical protein